MKKKILLFLIVCAFAFVFTGCTKEEEKEESVTGGWELLLSNSELMDGDVKTMFETAANDYKDEKLTAIAVLGEQVVAGRNYMFLARNEKEYKVVVLYKDLEGNAEITNVSALDYTKYVSKNKKYNATDLVGGWQVSVPGKPITIEENSQEVFDKAVENVKDIKYYPIATLGAQLVAGTNYAVLSYGTDSSDQSAIYVLTIYKDLQGNSEVSYSYYLDLAGFNK